MKGIVILVLLIVLFSGVVCGALTATGNDNVDMTGKIIGVYKVNNTLDSVLVQGKTSGDSEIQNISVKITKNTIISAKNGNNISSASYNDLASGKNIEVKFDEPIIQTYPPQTNASKIIIN